MGNFESIIITLYKGHYEKDDDGSIQYRTFGEFDYIKITDVLIEQNGKSLDYSAMWIETEKVSEKLKVGESCHNLYAIAVNVTNSENFWKDQEPYLFVSLLQFKCKIDGKIENAAEKIIDFLEENSFKGQEFRYMVYYSLDSCDFVIFIKSNKYEIGAKQIQSFSIFSISEKQSNNYCYSLCGIDFAKLKEQNENEIIKKVMICFVVKKVVDYQKWYKEFSYKFPQIEQKEIYPQGHFNYNRLGNEDVCINIMECDMLSLINEMCEGGCLHMKHPEFQRGTMKLRIHFDTQPYIDILEPKIEGELRETLQIFYIEEYETLVKEEAKEQLYPFVRKALVEVLKACSYFEKENFARHVQKCIGHAWKMLFKKMNDFCDRFEKETVYENRITYNESVVLVLQGIMSIVNGSLHTDRMFFQAPGFNAVLYDIPVKVLTFYNNYVELLVETLNENSEKEFCYLLCPDLYLSITIKKLFDNEKEYPRRRLLLGKVPVKTIFEPQKLMQELAHEVAHCVGDKIRKRSKRLAYTIAMVSETIATILLSVTDDEPKSEYILSEVYRKIGEEKIDKLFETLRQEIAKYFIGNFNDQQEEVNDENEEEFKYYQVKTLNFFQVTMKQLLVEDMDRLLIIIDKDIKKAYKSLNIDIPEYVKDLSTVLEILKKNLQFLSLQVNFIISSIHMLTTESFADLVMCEVLGIDMKEYIEIFYQKHKEDIDDSDAGFLNANTNATAERIVSVVRTYDRKIEEVRINSEEKNYKMYINKLMYYSEESTMYEGKMRRVLPPAVIRNNIKYLKECLVEIRKKSKEFESIRDIYEAVISGRTHDSVLSILNRIE